MIKKIFKYTSCVLGVILLIGIGMAIWFWDSISIVMGNKSSAGNIEPIPQVQIAEYPDITTGQNDWICWRGEDSSNSTTVESIPTDFSNGLTKLWEINYLCQSQKSDVWSAPVIQGNRLIACGRSDTDDLVFCLNPDNGNLIWYASYRAKAAKSFGRGSRATPWIDDTRVYTYGRSGDLVCWNLLDGEKIWRKNVKDDGGEEPTWGLSSSPYVTDSLVIVDAGGTARAVAYDKITGELKWKCGSGTAGYAGIAMMKIAEQNVILDFHGTGLAAILSETGKELWNVPWITNYDVNATTPMVVGEKIFITSGYNTGCQLLEAGMDTAEVVWTNENIASHHSDPFIIDGCIYGYSGMSMQNKGDFKCLDLETGEEKWSTGDMGWGTAIQVNDHLLCMDIKGNLFLMKPNSDSFKLVTSFEKALGRIKGAAWTKPIVANGKLYLRFKQKLICFDLQSDTAK